MKRADIFLIAVLFLLSAALFFCALPRGGAVTAEVYANGRLVKTLPLDENAVFLWEEGDSFVEITVENGTAFVSDANCPDRDCMRAGHLSRAGQSAVCLPCRVSVVLAGNNAASAGNNAASAGNNAASAGSAGAPVPDVVLQ